MEWQYTFEKPADNWFKPGCDSSAWKKGLAGFGSQGTPGAVVRTEWRTPDIWLRREFTLPEGKWSNLALRMHHDEDAEVYINGILGGTAIGYTTDYDVMPLTPDGQASLKMGTNVIAVHCHQTQGGQYIDVGLVNLK